MLNRAMVAPTIRNFIALQTRNNGAVSVNKNFKIPPSLKPSRPGEQQLSTFCETNQIKYFKISLAPIIIYDTPLTTGRP
jgi:hypothetical protein